jgi:hypothetical protein
MARRFRDGTVLDLLRLSPIARNVHNKQRIKRQPDGSTRLGMKNFRNSSENGRPMAGKLKEGQQKGPEGSFRWLRVSRMPSGLWNRIASG